MIINIWYLSQSYKHFVILSMLTRHRKKVVETDIRILFKSCQLNVIFISVIDSFLTKYCLYGNSLDFFTVPLHSPTGRHLPAIRAVQRNFHWGLQGCGNSQWSRERIMQWGIRQFQPITKGRYQSIGGHVSYPTDNHITARLGLCSSLAI